MSSAGKQQGQLNPAQIATLVMAEFRGAWKRFIFFIICIAIGVGAVMTIKSLANILNNAVNRESKSLLAADIAIQGSWEQTAKDREFQKQALPPDTDFVFIKELHGMARYKKSGNTDGNDSGSLIVELKSIPLAPPHYPLYGELQTAPQQPIADSLADHGAIVEPSFLMRTHLKVGDTFSLGKTKIRIIATVMAEPDRISRAFSIGPRVFVSQATLDATELIQPGSRVKHRTLIRLPESLPPDTAVDILKAGLEDKSLRFRTYKDMQSSLTDSIERMGQYLGALGVIALIMGGIGVAMIIRTFMAQKLDTIAILNCMGASSRTILKVYLLQSLLLGLIGSLLGVSLGYAALYLLPEKLAGLLNIEFQPGFYWLPAAQSLCLGMLTTLLFCAWPLILAVKTRPLRLFRRNFEEEEIAQGSRRERWTAGITMMTGLALIIFWQAESVKRGAIFLLALILATLILRAVALGLLKILRKVPPPQSMTRRYGLSNLYRPNNQAASIITCLGLGIMLVLTVRLVQMDMLSMLKSNTEINPPNYFYIDIQSDQTERFTKILDQTAPEAERELIPLIRSRLYSANGKKTADWQYKNRSEEEWFITRSFVLTHMSGPPPKDNKIVEGKWWSEKEASIPQVSVEEDAAQRLGLTIGSELTIEIQGIPISAPVTSIRKVNWRNMRTNFYMIFSPGALDGAPITYVATVNVSEEKELALQQAVVDQLPNVTALSTRDIVNTVESVVGKLKTLVDFMSGFSILSGLIILSGSIASTKYRRLKESAILKILGARRQAVASILGIEYAILGIVSGIMGAGLSCLLAWGVMKYLVKSEWHLYPSVLLWTVALSVLLTTGTGILSSLDVLKNKPFKTLRQADG
ncbi:MAG: FtsX-like permease family protein [Nitrospinae bacterium]|jgi:putative ABC transport system permease protein|nr:FtsX-like permease family protein [Nitrospinota bacterium]